MQGGLMMVALLSFTFPPPAESAGDMRPKIVKLLKLAIEPSAKNLLEVERYYRSLPDAVRDDRRFKSAYVAALIQQKRLRQASDVVHEQMADDPRNLSVWRTKIWLALTLGERTRALTDIEQLASHAHAHHTSGEEHLAETEMADFLGSVCGFLAGPWSQKVREADAQKIEERLRNVLENEARPAFDQARARVVERFDQLSVVHEQHVAEERKSKTKQLDQAKESIGRAAQQLSDRRQALKDKEAQRADDTKTKVTDIDDELKSIDQKRQSLSVQIAPLEQRRLALLGQLELVAQAMNPFTRAEVRIALTRSGYDRWGASRIQTQLAQVVTQLTPLEAKMVSLNEREQELLHERDATGAKYQTDLDKLSQQEQALDKDEKRVAGDARRLKTKPVATSPRLRSEALQLTTFSTYSPFRFDREKDRLLKEAD
ncbi:MAG TPA: hypothetical protein VHC22_00300 [Pirellulales bacterium]|nr:hypothetical protein [Pirellulales bacterium]